MDEELNLYAQYFSYDKKTNGLVEKVRLRVEGNPLEAYNLPLVLNSISKQKQGIYLPEEQIIASYLYEAEDRDQIEDNDYRLYLFANHHRNGLKLRNGIILKDEKYSNLIKNYRFCKIKDGVEELNKKTNHFVWYRTNTFSLETKLTSYLQIESHQLFKSDFLKTISNLFKFQHKHEFAVQSCESNLGANIFYNSSPIYILAKKINKHSILLINNQTTTQEDLNKLIPKPYKIITKRMFEKGEFQ